ncbi:MAG: hypothetical protein J6S73_05685, partial [Lentisphaeria bacterium]|nr:hypothetical protein [Lentisphaeria bacterium]
MGWFNRFGTPLWKAAESVLWRDGDASNGLCLQLGALFRTVLAGTAPLTDRNYEAMRFVLRNRSPQETSALMDAVRQAETLDLPELTRLMNTLGQVERRGIIHIALELAIGADRLADVREMLSALALSAGMTAEAFADLEKQLIEAEVRRQKLLRSGAGIGVALIIILIFILTATLLRSVIFGLIAAYVMLPVEKFFERRLGKPGTLLARVYGACSLLGRPLAVLAVKLQRNRRELSGEESA